jgi:hypothetical protein
MNKDAVMTKAAKIIQEYVLWIVLTNFICQFTYLKFPKYSFICF